MSSLPPSDHGGRKNPASMLNRFAKRDPQLYPLFAIMLGVFGVAGYFLTTKANKTTDPAQHLVGRSGGMPQTGSGSRTEEWKSHYRKAKGSEGADLE